MVKLIFWVVVFCIIFFIFPKIVGSFTLLAIVWSLLDEFVTKDYQDEKMDS